MISRVCSSTLCIVKVRCLVALRGEVHIQAQAFDEEDLLNNGVLMQLVTCEPAWKCSSCRQSSIPRAARASTRATISAGRRPNLALSPDVEPLHPHVGFRQLPL